MAKAVHATFAAWLIVAPAAHAGADAAQRNLIERAQQAERSLAAAQAACGAQRRDILREHRGVMQEVVAQMRTAKPADAMSADEMREWIDQHLWLMQKMMWQMTEHHMMLDPDTGYCGRGAGK